MKILQLCKALLQKYKRLILYIIFGGLNTVASLLLYSFLLWTHCNYLIASTIAYVFGIVLGFLMNAKAVFNSQNISHTMFIKYAVLYGMSYALNIFMLYMFVHQFLLNKLLAQVISTSVLVLLNFIASLLNSVIYPSAFIDVRR